VIQVVRNETNGEIAAQDEEATAETTTYEAEPDETTAGDAQAPDAGEAGAERAADASESAAVEAEGADTAEEAAQAQAENPEVTLLREQVQELQNRLLRTQADFDNFRRRTRMEKEEFAKYASQHVIEQLLPVVDNFERALAAGRGVQDAAALLKGVEMIYRQLQQVLEQEGVKPIEAVGRPFNPEYHQAVMRVESDEYEEGFVVEELQKGYMFKEKVIRPSMVKVRS
jgi:molecular chaperone GrpE